MAMAEISGLAVPVAQREARGTRLLPALSWSCFWLVAVGATLPLLAAYLRYAWRLEHYRYLPLLLLFSCVLVYQRWDGRPASPRGLVGWGATAASLLLLAAAGLLASPWAASVAFVALAAAFLWSHRESNGRSLFYLWFPLLLLIRLPLNGDKLIVGNLQVLTTRISSFLLDLVAVPHDVLGTVIQLPDRQLLVAEACSGIQSAFTLAFVALACAAVHRRSGLLLPIAIGTALMWAVLANVLRVSSVAGAAYWMDLDLSSGWRHEVLGYTALAVAILLVFSTDRLQACLFHPLSEGPASPTGNPLIDVWDRLFSSHTAKFGASVGTVSRPGQFHCASRRTLAQRATQVGRALLAFSFMLLFAAGAAFPFWISAASAERSKIVSAQTLIFDPPASIVDAVDSSVAFDYSQQVRDGSDPRLGPNADLWTVRHPEFIGELVFSRPYTEWHPLNRCYIYRGWEQTVDLRKTPGTAANIPTPIAVCDFQRNGQYGYLLYAGLLADGQAVDPPGTSVMSLAFQHFRKRLELPGKPLDLPPEHAMLQLWIPSPRPLSDAALSDALTAFAKVRDRFSHAMQTSHAAG